MYKKMHLEETQGKEQKDLWKNKKDNSKWLVFSFILINYSLVLILIT